MIRWLVQSESEHPALQRGSAPPALLNEREQARLDQLSVEKRRRDWLLGRWTAKNLLKAVLEQDMALNLPLSAIGIDNDVSGAPYAQLEGGVLPGIDDGARLLYDLSISHSGGYAFCAVQPGHGGPLSLGADIEQVDVRDPCFVETFFTQKEIHFVNHAPVAQRDRLITTIWSAKEAASKAMREGLRVDTRKVCCQPELSGRSLSSWQPLTVDVGEGLIGPEGESWPGWWRIPDGLTRFVLTMVVGRVARTLSPVIYEGEARYGFGH